VCYDVLDGPSPLHLLPVKLVRLCPDTGVFLVNLSCLFCCPDMSAAGIAYLCRFAFSIAATAPIIPALIIFWYIYRDLTERFSVVVRHQSYHSHGVTAAVSVCRSGQSLVYEDGPGTGGTVPVGWAK